MVTLTVRIGITESPTQVHAVFEGYYRILSPFGANRLTEVTEMGPAFPESEHRERLSRARSVLRTAGFDGCVSVAPEHLYYLGGYDAHTHFSQQALIFTVDDDEPTLIIRDADIACATETSWLRDVRTYHHGVEDPAGLVASVAREKGLDGTRLGTERAAYALPAAFYLRLLGAFRHTTRFDDVGAIVGGLRIVKSDAELEYVHTARRHSMEGLKTFFEHVACKDTEIALAGRIEGTLRKQGSDYPAMPTWLHSGPRTALSHAMPTDRVITLGEPVQCSVAGVARRYHVSVYHSVHLGAPSSRFKSLYAAAQEALNATVESVAIGTPVSVAAKAGSRVTDRLGLSHTALIRWGYGVGIGYPPAWLEPLEIIETSADIFKPGMVFCLHAHLIAPEQHLGVIVGGDYLLTEDALVALDTTGGSPQQRDLMVL